MRRSESLYIDGKWRAASGGATFTVIISATAEPLRQMAMHPSGMSMPPSPPRKGARSASKDYLDVKCTNMVLM